MISALPASTVISTVAKWSGEISRPDGTGRIDAGTMQPHPLVFISE